MFRLVSIQSESFGFTRYADSCFFDHNYVKYIWFLLVHLYPTALKLRVHTFEFLQKKKYACNWHIAQQAYFCKILTPYLHIAQAS